LNKIWTGTNIRSWVRACATCMLWN